MCGGDIGQFFEKGFEIALREVSKPVVKGMKKLTGAEEAEEANKMAREEMEANKAQMLQERENAKAQNAADQLAKSRQASAVRSRAGGVSTGASSVNILGGDERDFLGV